MARYIDASCRLCRKEKEKLFLKGDRCYSAKCALDRRGTAPGQHGNRRTKVSEYGMQLREKTKGQKILWRIGKAIQQLFFVGGKTARCNRRKSFENFGIQIDNVVYRLDLFFKKKKHDSLFCMGISWLTEKKSIFLRF